MATLKFADKCPNSPFDLTREERKIVDDFRKSLQPLTCDAKGRALQVGNMEIRRNSVAGQV